MQTLIERIDGFVPVVHTRVTRNDDAYYETELYERETIERLLPILVHAAHEQRQRLIRDDSGGGVERKRALVGNHHLVVGVTHICCRVNNAHGGRHKFGPACLFASQPIGAENIAKRLGATRNE